MSRHAEARHVYAIVRVDIFQGETVDWINRIKVTRVVWDEEQAAAEVRRLNGLNADKGALYFWQTTELTEWR
jgi:nucleoside diphosphate kinase